MKEKVKKMLGVKQRWCEKPAKRKLRFTGHITRGRCGSLVQLELEGTIDGKRDRGRQRRVWADVKNWSESECWRSEKEIWNTCEMADPGAQPSV